MAHMQANEIEKKASNATRWSAITEVAARCISPIVNAVLARLLTPEAFGVVATVTMVTSFAEMFTDAGFQKYLVQHDFEDDETLDRSTDVAFWTNLIISAALWGLIALFSEPIASLVGNPGLGNVIVVAALSLPFTSFASIQMARFKRVFQFRVLFYIRLVSMLVPVLVTIPLAVITRSYWALVFGTLATNLITALVLTLCSPWKPRLFFRLSLLKEMFSYSWWILMESIAIWLTSYIGTFIVGVYLNEYYLGIYKTSMATVNQITSLITAATSMPLFSAMSRLKDNEAELQRVYRKYIRAIGIVVIPLGVGIWLYRELITQLLLGSQWTEATGFIGLWGLTSSVSLVLGTYCNGYFNAKGKTSLSFYAQLLHLAALIPVLYITARRGYAVLWVARSLVRGELILVELLLMKFVMKFPVSKLFTDMLPALAATAVMTAASALLQPLNAGMVWQLCCVAACIAVYGGLMLLCFRTHLTEALDCFGLLREKRGEA